MPEPLHPVGSTQHSDAMTLPDDAQLLVVSPHYDDAVLSAFALLGRTATVTTVFTGRPDPVLRTQWDQHSGFIDSSAAMDQRQLEDDHAFQPIVSQRASVGLLDNQYVEDRTSTDEQTLVQHVRDWIAGHPDGVVVLPAGAGGPVGLMHRIRYRIPSARVGLRGGGPPHPDHLWVTDRLAANLRDQADIVLYEDLPYAWVKPADQRVRVVSSACGRPAEPFSMDVDVSAKGAAIEQYASQRSGNAAPWVRSMADVLPTRERYWYLRR